MAEQWERTVSCQDVTGRPRSIRVFLSERGNAVIQTPPGETAELSHENIEELHRALLDVSEETYRRSRRQ